jgi:hypothetical protein
MRPGFALAVLLVASPALAKPKLAVMEIQDAQGLGAALVESLTDSLRSLLARSGQFIVIDKSRQAAALRKLITAQKRESYKACYDNRCQIPLGQALAADSILRTKLTRVGSQYLLIAELVDLEKEAVTSAAQAQLAVQPTYGRDDRLLQGVLSIARQLSGDSTLGLGGAGTSSGSGDRPIAPPAEPRGGGTVAILNTRPPPPAESPADLQIREERARQARLEQEQRALEARQQRQAVAGADEIRRTRINRLAWGWLGAITGSILAAAGFYYVYGKGGSERDEADKATSPSDLKSHADAAKSAQTTGWVCVGFGAAAAAGGLALILTAPRLVQPVNVAGAKLDRIPSAGAGAQAFLVRWGGRF